MAAVSLYEPSYSPWSYPTSDARFDPYPPPHTRTQIVQQSPPSRPPPTTNPSPPAPKQIRQGVWLEDDNVIYTPAYPPVSEYLREIRKRKTMLPAPSDLIHVLAALSVLKDVHDVAHWIFWASTTYWTTGELVDTIALQKPRLIKTDVPWNGAREFKFIVNSMQHKFTCVHVQRKWYSTDSTGGNSEIANKRTTRSTADQPELSVNEYFGIVENEGPSSRRRTTKGGAARSRANNVTANAQLPPSPAKRTRRLVPTVPHKAVISSSSSPEPQHAAAASTQAQENKDNDEATTTRTPSPLPTVQRTSTRTRRKVTPSARSPRVISGPGAVIPTVVIQAPLVNANVDIDMGDTAPHPLTTSITSPNPSNSATAGSAPARTGAGVLPTTPSSTALKLHQQIQLEQQQLPPPPSPQSLPPMPTHVRNRSSSSESTVVPGPGERSPSVTSVETAVSSSASSSSSPKKRKFDEEDDVDDVDVVAVEKGMVTRHRGRAAKVVVVQDEEDKNSARSASEVDSRMASPVVTDVEVKKTKARAKPRAKRARVA